MSSPAASPETPPTIPPGILPPESGLDLLLLAIIIGILIVTIYAPIASVHAWRIYFADGRVRTDDAGKIVPDRSAILLVLAYVSTVVTILLLVAAALSIRRLLGYESWEWSSHAIGLALILGGTAPYVIDRTMRRLARENNGSPPPSAE